MQKIEHNRFLASVYNKYAPNAPAFAELPFGAIIGKAELVTTFSTDRTLFTHELTKGSDKWELTEQELAFWDYSDGRYGWLLKNAVQFQNPVPAKGALSIWEHVGMHEEEIICPECQHKQWATVEHTLPWWSYVHTCTQCKYIILESEWNKI